MASKITTLVNRAERMANREAVDLNKQLFQVVRQQIDVISLAGMIEQLLVDSFTDVVILGGVIGLESLRRETGLQLSLTPEIMKYTDSSEYLIQQGFYEAFAREMVGPTSSGLVKLMAATTEYQRNESLTEDQTELLFREVMKGAGFSPSTARNITNLFTTGLHLSYNGIRFSRTRYSPDVWGFRYQTAGDELVRQNHADQQGTVLPKEDPFWDIWNPPNGWRCRCSLEILFEEESIVEPDRTILPDEGFQTNTFRAYGGN